MGFSTDAIHAGQEPDPVTGAVVTPLHMTSTYAQTGLGKHKGYEYGRLQNYTREALEKNIAALEKGRHAAAFASGLAAIHAVMKTLKHGDHVLVTRHVYGGTYRLFENILRDCGLTFSWVNTNDLSVMREALQPNTRMLYIETPTNPLLSLSDLRQAADFAKEAGILSVVDNTFMTPYFQKPLTFGIDAVVHSTTKFINGHSDIIGGLAVTSNDEIKETLRYVQKAIGSIPSPFDCWLTLRSIKTLAVRMDRHASNAQTIATHLVQHPKVRHLYYPGLNMHPQLELAKKQMTGFGAVVSIDLGTFETAAATLERLKIFTLGESLGGVESLVSHPASMSHASVPEEARLEAGITDGLVRLSVGLEDADDLIRDLEQALE